MVNLLKLFCTDKQLLQTRGNLIIRQLCTSLSPERIYRTMADCLEKDEVRNLIVLFRVILIHAGYRFRHNHGPESQQQSHYGSRTGRFATETASLGIKGIILLANLVPYFTLTSPQGRPFAICCTVQGMVSQCGSNTVVMPACPSIRTGIQYSSTLVGDLLSYASSSSWLTTCLRSAEMEMTVNILIQIDKLIQLLESPVFTCMFKV